MEKQYLSDFLNLIEVMNSKLAFGERVNYTDAKRFIQDLIAENESLRAEIEKNAQNEVEIDKNNDVLSVETENTPESILENSENEAESNQKPKRGRKPKE